MRVSNGFHACWDAVWDGRCDCLEAYAEHGG
uniref:Uncharacterized protein n=1 Tax=Anguilla anguilla TaxID=7936 RepID=A0A0E9VIF0_ANGAN